MFPRRLKFKREHAFELPRISEIDVDVSVAFILTIAHDDFADFIFIFVVQCVAVAFVELLMSGLFSRRDGRPVEGFRVFENIDFVAEFHFVAEFFRIFEFDFRHRIVHSVDDRFPRIDGHVRHIVVEFYDSVVGCPVRAFICGFERVFDDRFYRVFRISFFLYQLTDCLCHFRHGKPPNTVLAN